MYWQHWLLGGWCHVKLLPSWCMFYVHHTTMHQFTVLLHLTPCTYGAYICVFSCKACFWQDDRVLLCATTVTRDQVLLHVTTVKHDATNTKIRVGIGSSPGEGASPGLKTCKLSAVSRVGYWAVPTPPFTTFYCIFPHPSMRSTLVTCIARYGCLGCRTEFSFVVIAPVVSLSLIQDFQFILSPLAALYNKKWSRVGHFCSDSEQA